VTDTDDVARIKERIKRLSERREYEVRLVWDDERALWLGHFAWTPLSLQPPPFAAEGKTVRDVLVQLGEAYGAKESAT